MKRTALLFSSLVFVFIVLFSSSPVFSASPLPDGVPNILDIEVQENYVPMASGTISGYPDFPLIYAISKIGQPDIMLGIDARNGKDSWTFEGDPIVFVALFSSDNKVLVLYIDAGFRDEGKPNGVYENLWDQDKGPAEIDEIIELTYKRALASAAGPSKSSIRLPTI